MSLPPKVSGAVSGHLVMKVDEVIWSQTPIDDILAVVMWWGGETSTTFRPVNLSRFVSTEDSTDVVYEIRTSLALFEKYLRKCGTLRIIVTNAKGAPIGIVRIPDIHNVIHVSPYENFFPIVTNSENRIGDLHVVFQLITFKHKDLRSLNNKQSSYSTKKAKNSFNFDDSLINSLISSHEIIHHNNKKHTDFKNSGPQTAGVKFRSKCKETTVRSKYRTLNREARCTSTGGRHLHRATINDPEKSSDNCEIYSKNDRKLSCSDLDDIFSQILERGQKLQKAITLSVIEDEVSTSALSVSMDVRHISTKCDDKPVTGDVKPPDQADSPKEKHISLEDKNKVIHYLQGKTMTSKEENEALRVLRGMSPTEGFLQELKDYCLKPVHQRSKIFSDESLYVDESSTQDSITQKSALQQNLTQTGLLPLYRVKCVKLSVIKLILNAIGFKRLNSPIPFKDVRQPLMGLTFFVEYKWPLSNSSNRPWAENISRFCSRRQVNDEILFNDYAIHNVPGLTKKHASEVLVTLFGKLTFRVCARQLNQRVPFTLGEASLKSIPDLFSTLSTGQELFAPVVASDGISVASLNVRIELGRDKVQFDTHHASQNVVGNLKPEDGSGNSTPQAITDAGIHSVTKTNNPQKHSLSLCRPGSTSEEPETSKKLRPPTAPNDAPDETQSNLLSNLSQRNSFFNTPQKAGVVNSHTAKKDSKLTANHKPGFKNHDLAITIQRVSDCHVISGTSPQNVHFIVAYRFPHWDASKFITLNWEDFSTDPAMCEGDLHFFGANIIHSSVLPASETFHSFLRSALERNGGDHHDALEFVLFFRSYYPRISDTPTGVALLPIETITTLEAAFANNSHVSESSCTSVFMDLPLQRIRNNVVLSAEAPIGVLHLKLDYRQICVPPIQREGSGDSQVDPFAEENKRLDKKLHAEDAGQHPLKYPWSLPPNIQTVNAIHVPDIAVAIHSIGKMAETYPYSAWLGRNDSKNENAEAFPSRRLETVFLTDPSDAFAPCSQPVQDSLEQSNTRRSKRHKKKTDSPISDDSEQGSTVSKVVTQTLVHAGTRTMAFDVDRQNAAVQPTPVSESVDLSLEDLDFTAAPVGPALPVKSCDASTCTDLPFKNDQEMQTNLPLAATGCQTSNSLTSVYTREEANDCCIGERTQSTGCQTFNSLTRVYTREEANECCIAERTRSPRRVIHDLKSDGILEGLGAGTKLSSEEEGETSTALGDDSQATVQPSLLKKRDSSKSYVVSDFDVSKTRREKTPVDLLETALRESPSMSECERNLLSRKPTAERLKRRAVTSVKQSRRPTLDRMTSESDRGVAGGDKSPVVMARSLVVGCGSASALPCRIEVECALHLPESEQSEENAVVFATVHSDKAESGQEILRAAQPLITPSVASRSDVYWNWSCQVDLPNSLFLEEESRLIFKVWQRKGKSNVITLIGIAAVDLTVLAVGLPVLDGWFNILDISGKSQGQIKVLVEPLRETSDLLHYETQLSNQTSLQDKRTFRTYDPICYYVAQGTFRNFPSHLIHHDNILVQKVENIPGLSSTFGQESLKCCECNVAATEDSIVTAKETSQEPSLTEDVVVQKDKQAFQKYLQQFSESSRANTDVGFEISSSGSLRETLTELDRLTSKMKERILASESGGCSKRRKSSDKDSASQGAVPKPKAVLLGKMGKSLRATLAQERVRAWDYQSPKNLDSPVSLRETRQSPELSSGDPRSRPYGKTPRDYTRCTTPLWEEQDNEAVAPTRTENEVMSDWIADAALREGVSMRLLSELLFQGVEVDQPADNPREGVKVVELNETHRAKFSGVQTPKNSAEQTYSVTENTDNGERLSSGNGADSGVDVAQPRTLSRRCWPDRQRVLQEQRMSDAQLSSLSEVKWNNADQQSVQSAQQDSLSEAKWNNEDQQSVQSAQQDSLSEAKWISADQQRHSQEQRMSDAQENLLSEATWNCADQRVSHEKRGSDPQRNSSSEVKWKSQSEATCSEQQRRLLELDRDSERTRNEQLEKEVVASSRRQSANTYTNQSQKSDERERNFERSGISNTMNSKHEKDYGKPVFDNEQAPFKEE